MKMMIRCTIVSVLCVALLSGAAFAQSKKASKEAPNFSLGANFGFQTQGNNGLLEMGFNAPIRLTEHYSIGPWMQVGVTKNTVTVLATANSRWNMDFLERTSFSKVEPFVQGGLGIAFRGTKGGGDQTDFLMNMGFGAEVPVTDHIYFGSNVMFNVTPTALAPMGFAFSWQFATLRYRF